MQRTYTADQCGPNKGPRIAFGPMRNKQAIADRLWTNVDQIIGPSSAVTKVHEGPDGLNGPRLGQHWFKCGSRSLVWFALVQIRFALRFRVLLRVNLLSWQNGYSRTGVALLVGVALDGARVHTHTGTIINRHDHKQGGTRES